METTRKASEKTKTSGGEGRVRPAVGPSAGGYVRSGSAAPAPVTAKDPEWLPMVGADPAFYLKDSS